MVGLSFLHFLIILVYDLYAFVITIYCIRLTKMVKHASTAWSSVFEKCHNRRQREIHSERFTMEIPYAQYNFANFRELLIGED